MLRNSYKLSDNFRFPKFIKVENVRLLKTYNDTSKLEWSFPAKLIPDETVDIDTLIPLEKKYGRTLYLSGTKSEADRHIKLINSAIRSICPDDISILLVKDIYENTYYEEEFEYWNITDLVRKYSLSSFDVFYAMIENALPCNSGIFSFNDKQMNIDTIKTTFYARIKSSTADNVYFDWWNGIGIKCHYPVDVNRTPFKLNMRRFNDRNNNTGYCSIIKLLFGSLSNKKDAVVQIPQLLAADAPAPASEAHVAPKSQATMLLDFSRFFPSPIKSENDRIVDDIKHELSLKPEYDESTMLFESAMEHRYYLSHRNNEWEYQMKPYYEKYIKPELEYCNITKFFGVDLSPKNGKFEKLSIVNMLIFGQSAVPFITFCSILELIRYQAKDNEFQLDNYVIKEHPCAEHATVTKKYKIEWRDDNINDLKFVETASNKLTIVKKLIKLMNEVESDKLNWINYYNATVYLIRYESINNNIKFLVYNENNRLKAINNLASL